MKMINLHQYYYKEYFKLSGSEFEYIFEQSPKGDKSLVADCNSKLTSKDFSEKKIVDGVECYMPFVIPNDCCSKDHSIQLQVSYPGLVTGIGINHEAKIEGEFKLGVHFDWTHGMPVVYGSSVKGVLRAWFKEFYKPTADQPSVKDAFDSIFEGKENGKSKSIYNRDIFFDAVIVEADSKGRILASDSITPHGGENHDNPLKNPTPLTFMKIASGCKMEFRFKLVPSEINGKTFTAAQKRTLFEESLKTVGIGAKTNVGYGQLK